MGSNYKHTTLIVSILVLISVSFPVTQEFTQSKPLSEEDSNQIYGFIIPLPSGNDTPFETLQNSRSRVLVNDLLRENITVYWATEQVDCLVSPILDFKNVFDFTFLPGAFIIPFVEDEYQNSLMTSIIFEYCINSELDDWKDPIEGYVLYEPILAYSYELVEPKIAQYFGREIRYGWPAYLQIADAGGFLTFDFFLDGETASLLSYREYNVFMWPYEPTPARVTEVFRNLIDKDSFNAIRRFVAQGGGYVGSCYGAQVASSGFINPLSLLLLSYAYQVDKPSFPFSLSLSMSDTFQRFHRSLLNDLFISTSVITNHSHPLTFGVNGPIKDFFSGPWFVYLGKNSESISNFESITLETASTPSVVQRIIGTPNWVTSTFGNGTLALFTSHPEFVNNISVLFEQRNWSEDPYYGRRIIQNSLFYVTGIADRKTSFHHSYHTTRIKEMMEKTMNLTLPLVQNGFFDNRINMLISYSSNLSDLQHLSSELLIPFKDLFSDTVLFQKNSQPLVYTYHKSIILQDYVQRTVETLHLLDTVLSLDTLDQNELMNSFTDLNDFIDSNLNQSDEIAQSSLELLFQIEEKLNKSSISTIEKIVLIETSRELITTIETSLKFAPQLYFESLKLLRHYWYQYKSTVALL